MRKILICLILAFSLALSVCANDNRIVDDADLLTDSEEESLEEAAAQAVEELGMDVVIVTCNDLEGKSAQSYADDYFDYNGYGVGSDYSGVLLLVCMDTREWAVSTCGEAIDRLQDYGIDALMDGVLPDLSDGNYEDAFAAFISDLSWYTDYGVTPLPDYDYDNDFGYADEPDSYEKPEEEPHFGLFQIMLSLVAGCAAGGVTLGVMRGKMNTARAQNGASGYLDGGLELNHRMDTFLYSQTSRTAKPQQTSSSSGRSSSHRSSRSSTHRSSSGRSHGGRSGRF